LIIKRVDILIRKVRIGSFVGWHV